MKNNLKYIGYILIFVTLNNFFISCNDDDKFDEYSSDESIVENILDNAYTTWNTSKNQVQEQMSSLHGLSI